MITYKLSLVCFSLVFPKSLSPHKEYFFQCIVHSLLGPVWGKHGLSCSLFSGNLRHLGHCGVFVQPRRVLLHYFWVYWIFFSFFFKIRESESLLTFPMFHSNPIITALFLSLPLLLFLVWAGVPQAYSTLPWVLTLLVEGMVWINVQQHRSTAHTLSSASSCTAALAEACTCLFAWSAFSAITLGSGSAELGCRWRWWLLSTGLWH